MKFIVTNESITISEFDIVEAYKIACKIEKDGIAFYDELAKKESAVDVRAMIEILRDEEKKHLIFFNKLLQEALETNNETFEDDNLFDCLEYGVFEMYKSVEHLEEIVSDMPKAFKLGMQVEDRAIHFYEACRDKVEDAEVKATLTTIIAEEKKHHALFEDLYNKCK